VGWIFCDLAKDIDCVNHDILLSILNFYGITDKDVNGSIHSLGICVKRDNRQKFQSQDIFSLGSYKTWYSTKIRFTSLIFSSLCK